LAERSASCFLREFTPARRRAIGHGDTEARRTCLWICHGGTEPRRHKILCATNLWIFVFFASCETVTVHRDHESPPQRKLSKQCYLPRRSPDTRCKRRSGSTRGPATQAQHAAARRRVRVA